MGESGTVERGTGAMSTLMVRLPVVVAVVAVMVMAGVVVPHMVLTNVVVVVVEAAAVLEGLPTVFRA